MPGGQDGDEDVVDLGRGGVQPDAQIGGGMAAGGIQHQFQFINTRRDPRRGEGHRERAGIADQIDGQAIDDVDMRTGSVEIGHAEMVTLAG